MAIGEVGLGGAVFGSMLAIQIRDEVISWRCCCCFSMVKASERAKNGWVVLVV